MPASELPEVAISKAQQSRERAWLKAYRHDVARVDKLKMVTTRQRLASLCSLHGVSRREYTATGARVAASRADWEQDEE